MAESELDIIENRRATKWTRREQVARVLWDIARPLIGLFPRQLWSLRRGALRMFRAKIGKEVHIHRTAHIEMPWNLVVGDYASIGDRVRVYNLGCITIGAKSTISSGAHLCAGTHDYRDPTMPLLKPPVDIGRNVWVCADAFIGPGIKIGDNAVIGARAVVMRDVKPNLIVAGNPACVIGSRSRES